MEIWKFHPIAIVIQLTIVAHLLVLDFCSSLFITLEITLFIILLAPQKSLYYMWKKIQVVPTTYVSHDFIENTFDFVNQTLCGAWLSMLDSQILDSLL